MIETIWGLLVKPEQAWQKLSDNSRSVFDYYLRHVLLLASIPAISWYIGITQSGWSIGGSQQLVRMTTASALPIIGLFYVAMLAGVFAIGYMIHWMADTYGAQSTLARGVCIAAYTGTPFFLAGIIGLQPLLWLDLLVGFITVSWTVYLLYLGVPAVMGVSKERGFLFASAVVGVSLVGLVAMMGATILLWDMGITPVFTD